MINPNLSMAQFSPSPSAGDSGGGSSSPLSGIEGGIARGGGFGSTPMGSIPNWSLLA